MRTLEEINERLSFYRNSDYRWVRELTTEFEKYFDKEFREFLSHKNLGGMTEAELKEIFLFSLNTLYRTISSDEYCLGDVDEKLSIFYYTHYSQHPARDEQISLNKKKVRELFDQVTMPWLSFEINILKHLQNYNKARVDIQELDKTKKSLEIKKEHLEQRSSYTKINPIEAANIEIAAALRTFPHPPTLQQLADESMNKLDKGKVSISVWSRTRKKISHWKMVLSEIDDRLQSNRKFKSDTIQKLTELKNFIQADLPNLEARVDWEKRKESGDIYEEKNALEYIDENIGYINTKIDKSPDLGDNNDDQEATEFDD